MSVRFWSCLKVVGFLLLLGSFLPEAEAAQARPAKLSVEYVYAPDGMLTGRTVNGQVQRFEYDKRGQLLAVKDAQGNDLERYVYDPAGNILSKTVHGKTTRFTYDAANQITSRTDPDGNVIRYQYDAAGRLVREGNRTYHYGWQDKVEEIRENGKTVARFTCGLDGQLETVTRADGSVEHFYWDGLALIGRGKSTFLNEPYVTGGNPIASDGKAMLNDMLGSTVGIRDGEKMTPVVMTAFGESADPEVMYTGKPHVVGLGYAFLFRNYRAELGKWQTIDPLGYPDGWNNYTYIGNGVSDSVDFMGFWTLKNDTGLPPTQSSVTSSTDWIIGDNHSAYGVYSITTFSWSQIGSNGGTNGSVSLTVGLAQTTSSSVVSQFSKSLSNSIAISANAKGGFPGIGEFSAGISNGVTGTVSGGYSLQLGTSNTESVSLGYSATAGANQYIEIIAYQLIATTIYYAKYLPSSSPDQPTPALQELGALATFSANLRQFGSRKKTYEE